MKFQPIEIGFEVNKHSYIFIHHYLYLTPCTLRVQGVAILEECTILSVVLAYAKITIPEGGKSIRTVARPSL